MTPHEFQSQRENNILSCYSNTDDCIIKSEENDLIKAGEGSKGGHVVGHDQNGKPVYEKHNQKGQWNHKIGTTQSGKGVYGNRDANHDDYKDFTPADHEDAFNIHSQEAKYLADKKQYKLAQKHTEHMLKHRDKFD
jgi:hypothetical protein